MSDQPVSQDQGSLTAGVARPQTAHRTPTLARTPPSRVAAVLSMHEMGVPIERIAKTEGMGKQTVYQIVKQGEHIYPEIVDRVKRHYAAHWWVTGERALQSITDEKLEAANASQLGILAAVATDKALLLEGKPTSRVEYMSAEDAQAAERIKALEDELSGWKDGTTLNVEGVVGGNEGESPTE